MATVFEVLVLALLYAGLGRLGQLAAIPPGHVTAIWAPSGVALAALVLRGRRVWPGIFLGSVLVNVWATLAIADETLSTLGVLMTAVAMAAGATLEGVTGAWLLTRSETRRPLSTGNLVVRFVFAGTVCCLVGATAGTTALSLAGFPAWAGYGSTWWTWWLGDLAGILVIAPLFMTWSEGFTPVSSQRRMLEAAAFVTALLVAGSVSFWSRYPVAYLIIPVLVWAAFRFGSRGATAAIFVLTAIAIAATARGAGPFSGTGFTLNESLLLLQGFMGTIVLSTVAMAALIAEREEAYLELRKHGDRLEDLVADRTAKLAASEREAIEASHAKSQFLANVSHELRTPLNAIIGYTELALEQARDIGQEGMAGDLGKVSGAAHHLLSVINDLLDLSKIEAGKLELTMERVVITPLVDDVVATVGPLAAKNNNRLVLKLAEPAPVVTADTLRLRQILFNLLSNACKFTENGTITLAVSQEGRHALFEVTDTGIGLTPEQLGKLFQPFVQADATTSRKYGGTGVGLVISRRLAVMMDGEIDAASVAGAGTTMTVRIPLAP